MRWTWQPCARIVSYDYRVRRCFLVSGLVLHHLEHATCRGKGACTSQTDVMYSLHTDCSSSLECGQNFGILVVLRPCP